MVPSFSIIYQSVNITNDISGEVLSFAYSDHTEGQADELSLSIKNGDYRWTNAWNPNKGDTVTASIITDGGTLPCGLFTVDDIQFAFSREDGSTVTINALSAGVKNIVRTKTSFAHEGKTLQTLAQYYANKYGWTVQGIIHNYSIVRVTQFHETDMEFLHRIAEEYGYIFNIKGKTMVFTYLGQLNATANIVTIDFSQIIDNCTIRDKVAGIYVRGQNRYHNPKTKSVYNNVVDAGNNPSVDSLNIREAVDNDQQGLYKADGRLYKKNLDQVEINLAVAGTILYVSGQNAAITGSAFGVYVGKYFIAESRHTITRNESYKTTLKLKKILPNKPTGNAPGQKVGYPPAANISAQVNVVLNLLNSVIQAINTNRIGQSFMFQTNLNMQAQINSIQQAGNSDVAETISEKWSAIDDETLTDSFQANADCNSLIAYLQTDVLNDGF